jgi:hypothetical protein
VSVHTPPRPVGVDELRRAWAAVQDGQFRTRTHPAPATRRDLRPATPGRWLPTEPVLPVIGCHGSAGTSTTALAIATAAGPARVIECCTLTASGLAPASFAELGSGSGWALGRRDTVLIARTVDVLVSLQEIPVPEPADPHITLTVLDIGWEIGQVLATPSWVGEQLLSAQHVVVVTTATVPGIRRLEGALALLDTVHVVAAVVGPRRRRWPRSIQGGMGPLVRGLDDRGDLVAIPADKQLAARGLDSTPLPPPLLSAACTLLRQVGDRTNPKGSP